MSEALSHVEEEKRRLRETLDETLHQVELQNLTIEELRLELETTRTRVADVVRKARSRASLRGIRPPTGPLPAVPAGQLTLAGLLPLARGAGAEIRRLIAQGVDVGAELEVLHSAIQLLREQRYADAHVVLHGLRVALQTEAAPSQPAKSNATQRKGGKRPPTPS